MDKTETLAEQVRSAADSGSPLTIIGGSSKPRPGHDPPGQRLEVFDHQGIVDYQPSELVITARAGTKLHEMEQVLAGEHQFLAFEPPRFGTTSTIGGTTACGLSGPRRPYAGGLRDFVLGVKMINGRGQVLKFGGRVIKNVAGYDISRLMVGSYGTLGCLLELSIKTLPEPRCETTLQLDRPLPGFFSLAATLARKPYPISAICLHGERMYIRLSGSEQAIKPAITFIGGEELADPRAFWAQIRDRTHPFFRTGRSLWRISLPPGHPHLHIPGDWLFDWGGGQRWLLSDAAPEEIRSLVRDTGGHATWIQGAPEGAEIFQTPLPPLMRLHDRIKRAFDPLRIFNRGRMYPGF